jgi:hypothetical protein
MDTSAWKKEAEKVFKEATKLSQSTFFKRAEWERATPMYEKAAKLFQVGCSIANSIACLPKCRSLHP